MKFKYLMTPTWAHMLASPFCYFCGGERCNSTETVQLSSNSSS